MPTPASSRKIHFPGIVEPITLTRLLKTVKAMDANVAQAESNELQAEVNFTKSLVDLDKAMGLTLSKNNIEIDKTLKSGTTAR